MASSKRQKTHGGAHRRAAVARAPDTTPGAASDPTSVLEDDAYHFRFYRGRPHLFFYTEWWYFAFSDPSGWAGISALAVFNPENQWRLGRCGITTVLFPPDGGAPVTQMSYLGVDQFSASNDRANVNLGESTLRVDSDGTYVLRTRDSRGQPQLDLAYRPAEAPRMMADEVTGYAPWETASWLVAMPSARVEGTVNTGQQQLRLAGVAGYHDHDWGLWEVTRRTWRWAQFSSPDRQLTCVIGVDAAFWYSTGWFRFGALQFPLPGELLRYEPCEWATWNRFWRYPTRVRVTAADASGQYQLEMEWQVTATAALWKSPVPLFEQRARFTGALRRKDPGAPGGWREVTSFCELGLAEYTDTYL
ncbi:hypothetical protein [Corallococcus sp. M7]